MEKSRSCHSTLPRIGRRQRAVQEQGVVEVDPEGEPRPVALDRGGVDAAQAARQLLQPAALLRLLDLPRLGEDLLREPCWDRLAARRRAAAVQGPDHRLTALKIA